MTAPITTSNTTASAMATAAAVILVLFIMNSCVAYEKGTELCTLPMQLILISMCLLSGKALLHGLEK